MAKGKCEGVDSPSPRTLGVTQGRQLPQPQVQILPARANNLVRNMKRYYYTDPLAAAWMQDKFGMFITNTKHRPYRKSTLCTYVHLTHQPAPERYYIHPDSVVLLEPQVGDIVQANSCTFWLVNKISSTRGGTKIYLGAGVFADVGEIKIIQRKGVAFMWPEVEE